MKVFLFFALVMVFFLAMWALVVFIPPTFEWVRSWLCKRDIKKRL
jgi:hypothetical protein